MEKMEKCTLSTANAMRVATYKEATMKKMYIVYTFIYGTRYFIGLYDKLKIAKEIASQFDDAKIEIYTE